MCLIFINAPIHKNIRITNRTKGGIKLIDYEYKRKGVCNIFIATEHLIGKRMVKVTDRKTKRDWTEFVQDFAEKYSTAKNITLVMDNLNTHKPSSLYEAFAPEIAKQLLDKFEFVYTPKHGSWLNMAEIELNVLNGQCLNKRIDNKETVIEVVNAWQEHQNNKNASIDWQFTTKEARVKLKRLHPSFNS